MRRSTRSSGAMRVIRVRSAFELAYAGAATDAITAAVARAAIAGELAGWQAAQPDPETASAGRGARARACDASVNSRNSPVTR